MKTSLTDEILMIETSDNDGRIPTLSLVLNNKNMNKHLIKLALETLLEQLVDSREKSTENEHKIKLVEQEIKLLNI